MTESDTDENRVLKDQILNFEELEKRVEHNSKRALERDGWEAEFFRGAAEGYRGAIKVLLGETSPYGEPPESVSAAAHEAMIDVSWRWGIELGEAEGFLINVGFLESEQEVTR